MTNAYILFREMNWKPSDYYDLPEGERIVVRSFLEKLFEEKKEETERIEKIAKGRKK